MLIGNVLCQYILYHRLEMSIFIFTKNYISE